MSADGTLTTTAAVQSRTSSYSITYQVTPWLEGTFRYTGFNEFFHYDRNYEAKVRLWSEQRLFAPGGLRHPRSRWYWRFMAQSILWLQKNTEILISQLAWAGVA